MYTLAESYVLFSFLFCIWYIFILFYISLVHPWAWTKKARRSRAKPVSTHWWGTLVWRLLSWKPVWRRGIFGDSSMLKPADNAVCLKYKLVSLFLCPPSPHFRPLPPLKRIDYNNFCWCLTGFPIYGKIMYLKKKNLKNPDTLSDNCDLKHFETNFSTLPTHLENL